MKGEEKMNILGGMSIVDNVRFNLVSSAKCYPKLVKYVPPVTVVVPFTDTG